MSSPKTIALAVKTIGITQYTNGSKVWLVSLDPKFSRPFITGTVTDDTKSDDNLYKVECSWKEGLNDRVTALGMDRFLCEMVFFDGITRDDERIVTNAVHEARMLRMSLEAINAVGIECTAFTQYPVYYGETNTNRRRIPLDQYTEDANLKIIDLIVRCNEQSNTATPTAIKTISIEIPSIKEIKMKIENHMANVEQTKLLVKETCFYVSQSVQEN
jgi:hypothetical protein